MNDLKVKDVTLAGKWFDITMRTLDDDTLRVYFDFDLPYIADQEKLLDVIKDISDDLFALRHEIEYGHTFDELPVSKTETKEGDTF